MARGSPAVMPPCQSHGAAPATGVVHRRPRAVTGAHGRRALDAPSNDRHTILISGGTGTGKTTLLNALAARLPSDERVVVVEETAELQITVPNVVRLEERRCAP